MPHKSVVFLDFDGVLNNDHTFRTFRGRGLEHPLEPELVERVGALVRETQADVVISSAWRALFSVPDLRDLLAPHIPGASIIGQTPDADERGQEIAMWLDRQDGAYRRVAVLDDNDFGYFNMDLVRPWLVKTNEHLGVSPQDIARARRLLGPKGRAYRPLALPYQGVA